MYYKLKDLTLLDFGLIPINEHIKFANIHMREILLIIMKIHLKTN